MSFEEGEPLTDTEKRYLKKGQKKFYYTDDKENKDKTPLSGGMKGKSSENLFSKLFRALIKTSCK